MSTQYTVFWCFFHVVCMYRARRGASKSIVSGSLCSLSIGSTGKWNTVCLFLKFWPPGINPELMMECKLLHIQRDKCTRRNRPELVHCPAIRINKIASWMTLKSSEIKNFSWRISAILKYALVTSAFCHDALPLFITPMSRMHKMFRKIIF